MTQERKALRRLVRGALIAAIYAVLCAALAPISYGEVQFRISEALTILPLLMPEAVPGLFVGCLIANLIGGAGILDIVFGSLATLIAGLLTYAMRKCRPGWRCCGGGGQRPCRGLGAERGLRNAAAAGDGVGCAGPGRWSATCWGCRCWRCCAAACRRNCCTKPRPLFGEEGPKCPVFGAARPRLPSIFP